VINLPGKPVGVVLAALCMHGMAEAGNPDPLFSSNDTLQVTLEAPFDELMSERDEKIELPGNIQYTAADGKTVELAVQVRTRGKFRARRTVCDFAPIRLNFKTSEAKGALFAKQDKLKLVTQCDSNS